MFCVSVKVYKIFLQLKRIGGIWVHKMYENITENQINQYLSPKICCDKNHHIPMNLNVR